MILARTVAEAGLLQAEDILRSSTLDKEYLPITGLAEFTKNATRLAYGNDSVPLNENNVHRFVSNRLLTDLPALDRCNSITLWHRRTPHRGRVLGAVLSSFQSDLPPCSFMGQSYPYLPRFRP